jgi:hypothetical protein
MQLALWSAMAVVGISVSGRLAGKMNLQSIFLGLVICWLTLALVSSVFAVGISYLFIIPSLVSAIILLAYPTLRNRFAMRGPYFVYIAYMTAIAVMFLPVVYTLEIMITYEMSVAIGVMFAFVLIGLVPVSAAWHQPHSPSRRIQAGLVIGFLIGFIWLLAQAPFDQVSRQRVNLYHLQNHDAQSNVFINSASEPLPESLNATMLSPAKTEVLAWSKRERYSIAVENAELAGAVITKSERSYSGGTEILLTATALDQQLRGLTFYIQQNPDVSAVTFFDKQFNLIDRETSQNGYYRFNCVGLSCQEIHIKIKKSGNKKSDVLILKSVTGLPPQDDKYVENRGATAHQYQFGDQSLIISRIEI